MILEVLSLSDWHERLNRHFRELRRARSASTGDKPIFALEHGLSSSDFQDLSAGIRNHILSGAPSLKHSLPWIVYAAEIGYRYSGDEYWQTFEDETPGWVVHAERDWLRARFRWFHDEFHGAKPSGPWANHFSIICWPITHAILPRDLQVQLARVLYELRHRFSADLFESPVALGELIAASSWGASSRFQNLSQETALVGQIATALLLEGDFSSAGLLLPATLKRIGADVDRERSAREWLRGARRRARERAHFRGLSPAHSAKRQNEGEETPKPEGVSALGIEPALLLRPADSDAMSWDVLLEIPDLSHLLVKFPEFRDALAGSRCVVAGSSGRPLARGRVLQGPQRIKLERWPRNDELLLQFERSTQQLEYLLRSECMLRPGVQFLFHVASDGLAYDLRALRVRAGMRYVLISTESQIPSIFGTQATSLLCEGAYGVVLDIPPVLSREWALTIRELRLAQTKYIDVWPAGLPPSSWDGEGRGEWLSTDKPCIGIRADHDVSSVTVTVVPQSSCSLDISSLGAGQPVFVELPALPVGLHELRVTAREYFLEEILGELELVIREPRDWITGVTSQGPLILRLDPPAPNLEELWEGRVDLEILGPAGRDVSCMVNLHEHHVTAATVSKRMPDLTLPVTANAWKAYFDKNFRQWAPAQAAYDASRVCKLQFNADDLGAFEFKCEREFTVLRWLLRRSGDRQMLVLLDDSDDGTPTSVGRFDFVLPADEQRVQVDAATRSIEVPPSGGMYVASHGAFVAAVIAPPVVHALSDLGCNPMISDHTRSISAAAATVKLICLWSQARLTGNVVSSFRQRQVQKALSQHLFYVLGGENWARVEASTSHSGQWLRDLKHAVSSKPEEAVFATALAREHRVLVNASSAARVKRFAEFAESLLHISVRARTAAPVFPTPIGRLSYARRPNDHEWLCEFALRLASDPAATCSWAGAELMGALKQLYELPILARAARFLILAIEEECKDRPRDHAGPHAGWDWT